MDSPPAAPPSRLRALDALRAIAVVLVLGRHLPSILGRPASELDPFTAAWSRGGWVGVDLFFVLSGFLVSGLVFRELQRTGGFRPLGFLGRRGFKIYPAFWVMIAVSWLLAPRILASPPAARLYVHELLFVQNYLDGVWNHTWSLAIEEHFYLLLSLGLWWAAREQGRVAQVPAVSILVLLLCLALRVWTVDRDGPTEAVMFHTHLRIDALLFGVGLSHAYHVTPGRGLDGLARRSPVRVACLGAALLVPPFLLDIEVHGALVLTLGLSLFTVGAGLLLLGLLHGPALGGASARVVSACAWVGSYSYSIYLWHMLVGVLCHRGLDLVWPTRPVLVEVAVFIVASIALGIGLGRVIELPALRLRDRLIPSRAGALPPG